MVTADDPKNCLARDNRVQSFYGGRLMDWHGWLLAHPELADSNWVQEELLSAGLVQVYSSDDNRT